MRRALVMVGLAVAIFAVAALGGAYASRWRTAAATAPTSAARDDAQDAHSVARGEVLFVMHCARCHGNEGRGDAEGAEKLLPPPRDFASRPWKFTPTRDSIVRVTREGIPGTSMPAFGQALTGDDLAAVTGHVLTLATPAADATSLDTYLAAGFTKLKTPRAAPTLTVEDAQGAELTLEKLRGKVVLLNFWGETCPHCLTRMPKLAELQNSLNSRGFVAVNICTDADDASSAQALLAKATAQLTTHVDATGLAVARYEVSIMPTIWLLDRQGNLLAKSQGARDWNDPRLRALLDEILAAP